MLELGKCLARPLPCNQLERLLDSLEHKADEFWNMSSTFELNGFSISIEVDPGVALDAVLCADFVLLAAHVHLYILDVLGPFEVFCFVG